MAYVDDMTRYVFELALGDRLLTRSTLLSIMLTCTEFKKLTDQFVENAKCITTFDLESNTTTCAKALGQVMLDYVVMDEHQTHRNIYKLGIQTMLKAYYDFSGNANYYYLPGSFASVDFGNVEITLFSKRIQLSELTNVGYDEFEERIRCNETARVITWSMNTGTSDQVNLWIRKSGAIGIDRAGMLPQECVITASRKLPFSRRNLPSDCLAAYEMLMQF